MAGSSTSAERWVPELQLQTDFRPNRYCTSSRIYLRGRLSQVYVAVITFATSRLSPSAPAIVGAAHCLLLACIPVVFLMLNEVNGVSMTNV